MNSISRSVIIGSFHVSRLAKNDRWGEVETRVSEDQEGSSWTRMPNVISAILGLFRVPGVPISACSSTLRADLSYGNEDPKVGSCQVSVPRDQENRRICVWSQAVFGTWSHQVPRANVLFCSFLCALASAIKGNQIDQRETMISGVSQVQHGPRPAQHCPGGLSLSPPYSSSQSQLIPTKRPLLLLASKDHGLELVGEANWGHNCRLLSH